MELIDAPTRPTGTIRAATFPIVTSHLTSRTFHQLHNNADESGDFQVCAGTFRLHRSNDKNVYGFSFGGWLSIHNGEDCTRCRLDSPAPLFDLPYEPAPPHVFLHSEFVATLARFRAGWRDDAAYGRCLAAADPFELFIAMLSELDSYLRRFRFSTWVDEYRQGWRTIQRAIDTLKAAGEWPLEPLSLAAVLGQSD